MARTRLHALTVTLVTLVLLAVASAASASTWHRISAAGQSNTSQVSLLRNADGSLTAIGLFKTVGSGVGGADIVRIPISSKGLPGVSQTLLSSNDWGILENPAVIRQADRSLVVFGGLSSAGADSLWTYDLDTAALTQYGSSGGGPTSSASGTSAAATATGGFAAWSGTFGIGTLTLGNTAATPSSLPLTGCCAYNQNFAALGGGGVWVGYDSNENDATGRWFQQVDPTTGSAVGARVKVPKTSVGGEFSFPVESRVPIAVVGTTAYTAWAQGYPSTPRIGLWQLGATKAKLFSPGYTVGAVGVAATPTGALWVYWTQKTTGVVYAMRTNKARTNWANSPITVGRPNASLETVYKLVGDASRADGKLDLVAAMAHYAGSPTWYHVLVKP